MDAIVRQLMRVHGGQTLRLLINQPPRSLKSICVSVAYVAWPLGHDPTRRFIVGELFGRLRRRTPPSVPAWSSNRPGTPSSSPDPMGERDRPRIRHNPGGGRYATSVGGTLTGRGADVIIVDDPLNANEAQSEAARKKVIDWYGGALVSRLNDKRTGAIIAVMQRLHEDDLAGHLLRQGGWDHLDMPAIALEDEDHRAWARQDPSARRRRRAPSRARKPGGVGGDQSEIGSLLFSAQYQQRPVPVEGNLIRRAWFRYTSCRTARCRLPQSRAKLGCRHDDGRPERLFGLHDLAHPQG